MTIDLEDLRRKAEAATPGPWLLDGELIYVLEDKGFYRGMPRHGNRFSARVSSDGSKIAKEELQANAAHIAASNPITILALLDEVKQVRMKALEEAAVFFETHMAALCTGPGQNGEVKMVRTDDAIDPAQAAQAAAIRALIDKEPA